MTEPLEQNAAKQAVPLGEALIAELRQSIDAPPVENQHTPPASEERGFALTENEQTPEPTPQAVPGAQSLEEAKGMIREGFGEIQALLDERREDVEQWLQQQEGERKTTVEKRIASIKEEKGI